jgi:hypothetical protein
MEKPDRAAPVTPVQGIADPVHQQWNICLMGGRGPSIRLRVPSVRLSAYPR